MQEDHIDCYDKSALLDRLTYGVLQSGRSATFLVGSAVTAPPDRGQFGVPGVKDVIDLIRHELPSAQQSEFDREISQAQNSYQAAFHFLIGRRGQQAANEIIKNAVWKARKSTVVGEQIHQYRPGASTSDEACRALDGDLEGWHIPPAAASLGQLVSHHPNHFGGTLLTTNFDPLLEVSIRKAGGQCFRTVLHRDGNLGQTEASGCHVVHLHGYWYGSDTLHTPRQLTQPRPRLKASLSSLVKTGLLIVIGYGGWDDTFTQALVDLTSDDTASPEIVWAFNEVPSHSGALAAKYRPAIDRGRLNFYNGVNCHTFFPELVERWRSLEETATVIAPSPNSTRIRAYINFEIPEDTASQTEDAVIEGADADRPPVVDICVGRQDESKLLIEHAGRACFITGFGGQGKSTLAAQYFSQARKDQLFDYFIWRDCKEESARFENQLIAVIARLSRDAVRANELSHQGIEALTDLLIKFANGKRILFVFDNIDHYVDLENNTLSGNAEAFIKRFLNSPSNCRVIMTCRPLVQYPGQNTLTLRLEGLSLGDSIELFSRRGAKADIALIKEAHEITKGHAFWIDLMAAQVAKRNDALKLDELLSQIAKGTGEIPTVTLRSIWETLTDKQKTVLRAMAETVKSEAEEQLAEYLNGRMNFNQVTKALRSLRSLNLIVVKARPGSADVLELHPLVREFVRRTFHQQERVSFIDGIIAVYKRYIGRYKSEIKERATQELLQIWSENAELCVAAGKLEEAFETLADVSTEFAASAAPAEFARVCNLLLDSISWEDHAKYPKFDRIVRAHARVLANLNRGEEVRQVLDKYRSTFKRKDARYVAYCDIECYVHWINGQYSEAIKWGETGKELKEKSGVDTQYDTGHHLALAQRDSGIIDAALKQFLGPHKLDDVIDPEEFSDTEGGAFYGNIGRCLHLMGQIDPALICYRKSAISLQTAGDEHVENQGYIRKWIGELLVVRGEFCAAQTFLEAARDKWDNVCPRRIPEIEATLEKIKNQTEGCQRLNGSNRERFCIAWIYGREADFIPLSV